MLYFESISDPSSEMNKNTTSYKFIGKRKQTAAGYKTIQRC